MMRKSTLLLITLLLFGSSCEKKEKVSISPIPSYHSIQTIQNIKGSGELPITPKVNLEKIDNCTKYLLFTDQYVTASDYPSAEDTLKEAEKYCSPTDPRFNYLKAVLFDIEEKRDKAYSYYYKAAKEYIKIGKLEEAFKCYSGMLSINPEGKEVKELKSYFEEEY